MKKALFSTGVSIILLLTALVGFSRNVLADCVDFLDHRAYRCRFTGESGETADICMTTTASNVEGKFTLQGTGFLATALQCSCQVGIVSGKLTFNASNRFLCGNQQYGDAAEGTVIARGKSIVAGQYFFNSSPDFSLVFTCFLAPSCAP